MSGRLEQLKFSEICKNLSRGKSIYTKTYCRNNHGAYPVYSATNNAPLGNINTYDYDGRFLTISINGLAGKITIFDEKFSTNADRVVMLPKEGISIDYIRHVAEPILRNSVKGRKGDLGKNEFTKLTPTMILNTYIPIPLNEDNSFNYERQCELASIYNNIEQQKKILLDKLEMLSNISVLIDKKDGVSFKKVLPSELFIPKNGNSKYTKEYCKNHKGDIPLFSGNTDGIFDKINSYDYDGEYLTWAKDGLAGYMMIHSGKFALTGHRGILIPTDICQNIDLKYIKYVLEPLFRAHKTGREGDLGKNEYTTLNSDMIKKITETIPIPIKDDGSFDIKMQKELANRYEQIDEIKTELAQHIISLTDITIN